MNMREAQSEDLITVIYACGHSIGPHKRMNLGFYGPNTEACECKSCWPDAVKDLRAYGSKMVCFQCYLDQGGIDWQAELLKKSEKVDEDELVKCPFCGNTNPEYDCVEFSRYSFMRCVKCGDCGACGPFCKTQEQAKKGWNRRI